MRMRGNLEEVLLTSADGVEDSPVALLLVPAELCEKTPEFTLGNGVSPVWCRRRAEQGFLDGDVLDFL